MLQAPMRIVLSLLIAAAAYLFCFHVGQQGFFPMDQSIVFDGGWRILQGQVPYQDFDIPFGPVSLWLHAFFIKLLGATFFSYLFHAALINALACLLCIAIMVSILPNLALSLHRPLYTTAMFIGFAGFALMIRAWWLFRIADTAMIVIQSRRVSIRTTRSIT